MSIDKYGCNGTRAGLSIAPIRVSLPRRESNLPTGYFFCVLYAWLLPVILLYFLPLPLSPLFVDLTNKIDANIL